jgi:1-deoxy-D-xylulose-5-phosphate reductoisomerase
MQNLCVLGATGSIGQSTLDIISRHPDKFRLISASANTDVSGMLAICQQFQPEQVVMADAYSAEQLYAELLKHQLSHISVDTGESALVNIATSEACDTVMAAIVGASGLMPTFQAVKAGKKVLLANKEALVTSGQLFIDALKESGAVLLPIDSEHNAIFQCLPLNQQQTIGHCQLANDGIAKILLTGSGGPFRDFPLAQFESITPEQACAHPNWVMGKKISVDSATMMNKGLEFIEAKWLFNVEPSQIQVVIHPQSTIHSMVQYIDGSVVAQLGNPDMRTPIAHALSYPERISSGVEAFDFFNCQDFTFKPVDFKRYPNLALAIEACELGQAACTAMNAANEVAVAAFLNKQISFTDIFKVNQQVVSIYSQEKIQHLADVFTLDQQARNQASALITQGLNQK